MSKSVGLQRPRDARAVGAARRPAPPPIPGFNPRAEDQVAHYLRRLPPVQLALVAGIVSALVYVGFVLAFPIFAWWNHPHIADTANSINDMGRITGYSPLAAFGFVVALLILFCCQFFVLIAASGAGSASLSAREIVRFRRIVLGMPLVFAAIMIWMQPVTTTDLYGYIARGYLFAHLHQNPMTTAAQLLPGGLTVDRPASPYGPGWLVVTWLFSKLSGENLLLNMLLFKFTGFFAVAVALWLVDHLARELYPDRPLRACILFGWSPLLIFEAVGNGHNDIVMMVCVLLAFTLMLRGRSRLAFAFLVLGALIKYVSAVFVALWLIYELRHRVRSGEPVAHVSADSAGNRSVLGVWWHGLVATVRELDYRAATGLVLQSALLGGVLVAVFYAPFWVGLKTFTGLGQQIRPLYYNSSIVGFFAAPLAQLVSADKQAAFDKTVRLICYTVFFAYAYFQVQRLWFLGPRSDMRHVITAAAKIVFAALLLITFWFQPWYVIWLLPLVALSDEPFVRRQGMFLAAGALFTYAVSNFLFVEDSDFVKGLSVQFFEILVVFGPLLLLRTAPFSDGWRSIARRYAALFGEGLARRPVFWYRVMLVLVVVVAALLRLVRLGSNLFTEVPQGSPATAILSQASGALTLFLSDPQGLSGPFAILQNLLVGIFGRTPFAMMLPSAVVGSLTVLAIYLLTCEIMRQGGVRSARTIGLLAALLVATSRWHVSLSRQGVQVVLLPLLMCLAVYWLLLGLRSGQAGDISAATPRASTVGRQPNSSGRKRTQRRKAKDATAVLASNLQETGGRELSPERRAAYLTACGICTGLACDLAPGLWLVPLTVGGLFAVWRWRRPAGGAIAKGSLAILTSSAIVSGLPALWHLADRYVGFPPGSPILARTGAYVGRGPAPLSPQFWQEAGSNLLTTLQVLVSQDFSAGYPSSGGTPIIPALLLPFFVLGLVAIVRWRGFASTAMLALLGLPILASVSVGTPTSLIAASSLLPALCIVPAVGLLTVSEWLGHLLIVVDRTGGVRIFLTPEQTGRLLLLLFLLVSTIRTFFWYFEATLPTPANQQWTPSLTPSHTAVEHVPGGSMVVWVQKDVSDSKTFG